MEEDKAVDRLGGLASQITQEMINESLQADSGGDVSGAGESNGTNSNAAASGSNSGSSGAGNAGPSNSNSNGSGPSGSSSGNTGSGSAGSNAGAPSKPLKEVLLSATTLHATTAPLVSLAYPTQMETVQGGCVYGNYYYQAFIKADNSGSVIVKYDMERHVIVAQSDILKLNHTNDMTYNSKLDRLLVVHNDGNYKRISYIYPDTLKVEKTKDLSVKLYALDYNEKMDRYVLGIAGTTNFQIADSNFKLISSVYPRTDSGLSYTRQGCACDDDFIYFVLWNKNVIVVYDWSGKFVTLIQLDLSNSIEPEHISIVNDKIYIGCRNSGKAFLYRVDL